MKKLEELLHGVMDFRAHGQMFCSFAESQNVPWTDIWLDRRPLQKKDDVKREEALSQKDTDFNVKSSILQIKRAPEVYKSDPRMKWIKKHLLPSLHLSFWRMYTSCRNARGLHHVGAQDVTRSNLEFRNVTSIVSQPFGHHKAYKFC